MSTPENCIDIVKPFVHRLDEVGLERVQIFGGIYSAALKESKTIIDVVEKRVIAPDDLYLPTVRDDELGSLRDVDVLVQSANQSDVDEVLSIMRQTIGNKLELSAFGYKSSETLRAQLRSPLGMAAIMAFVSDRFVDPRSDNPDDMVKSVFPFWVNIDPESLETWRLQIGDQDFPVPNPVSSLINYTNRSISGIRPKDVDKVMGMAETIFSKAPELRDWAIDGAGKSQVDIGVLLRSLTPQKRHADPLGIGDVRPLTTNELASHEDYFMVPSLDDKTRLAVVGLAKLKANMIHTGESNDYLRSFYQSRMEHLPFFDRIVKSGHGVDDKKDTDREKSVV